MTIDHLLLATAYFPPISYFSALSRASRASIEQYENFCKQSYRNRCHILTANGVIPLTVPVARANSKTPVRDLRIVYDTPWQKLHLRGIESAYRNSPFYDYYMNDLVPFFERRESYLFDLNQRILSLFCELLPLRTPIGMTSDYVPAGTPGYTDLRSAIHPKPARRSPFPFSPGELPAIPYHQTFSDRFPFTPDLSILDLLFCCGPEAAEKL